MKTKKLILTMAAVIALSMLLVMQTSCKKDEDEKSSLKIGIKSTTALRATYDAVYIDILSASIHTSTDPGVEGGWFDLPTEAGIYDLLLYHGDEAIIAIDPVLEPQTVSQIRLLLGEQNTIVVDGETYTLDTPSAQTSGLKIQLGEQLEPGVAYLVVLDFDVDKSIVETGNGKYKLQPVIKATLLPL